MTAYPNKITINISIKKRVSDLEAARISVKELKLILKEKN
jgi:hypothetical protein